MKNHQSKLNCLTAQKKFFFKCHLLIISEVDIQLSVLKIKMVHYQSVTFFQMTLLNSYRSIKIGNLIQNEHSCKRNGQ